MTHFRPAAAVFALLVAAAPAAAEFEIERTKGGVAVKLGGQLFTEYLTKSGNKPIMWPLIGPGGQELTRAFPMRKGQAGERADHPHHRSFWFTHGDVNGISFWHEGNNTGEIVHKEFVKVEGGKHAEIVTRNDWIHPNGKKLCEDARRFVFATDGKSRWIDCELTVTASEGPVKFGDTKEGSFGVRVAGTMKVTGKPGGKILNSEGQTDAGAWGKPAKWVAYYGPVGDKTAGIAILNHPTSFRYPTYWHVRTYGLFAANPFGLHDFKRSKKVDGSHELKKGESFTLKYRVLLHEGEAKPADIEKHFAAYAGGK